MASALSGAVAFSAPITTATRVRTGRPIPVLRNAQRAEANGRHRSLMVRSQSGKVDPPDVKKIAGMAQIQVTDDEVGVHHPDLTRTA